MIIFAQTAIKFFIKHRFRFYAGFAVLGIAFALGGYSGWKFHKLLHTSDQYKIIERKINVRNKQDEIDAMPYDTDSFRNDILRRGRL